MDVLLSYFDDSQFDGLHNVPLCRARAVARLRQRRRPPPRFYSRMRQRPPRFLSQDEAADEADLILLTFILTRFIQLNTFQKSVFSIKADEILHELLNYVICNSLRGIGR